MAPESSQALDRGLRLLRALADSEGSLSVTDLAGRLELSRPVVYRLVTTLQTHGWVRRDSDGRCRLGLSVLELARHVQPLLRDTARGPLRRLAEQVGATAHLSVLDAGQALAVVVVEPSWTDFHVAYRVGSRHGLEQGAAGRAILTGRRPVRAPDYVCSVGELQPGAYGIAAPVRDVPGVEASVGVIALSELDSAEVGAAVVAAAVEVADALR